MITTCFDTLNAKTNEKMTGKERYPVFGNLLIPEQIEQIMSRMEGLNRYWDCIEKARIAKEVVGAGVIILGECLVWSEDYKSSYGFYFNPPFELHAWLQPVWRTRVIIDVALPGVIEKGLITSDEIGPCVIGRSPIIIAGKVPDWVTYHPVIVLS